ncbi:ABC transporter substrate-binding protein [Ectobacillus sp. JY-23]|uniref:ABC transporter substrate-binding protein n=1 Tax=Ectobacillus sp. JY-23 TaxID=2933872 RepID=UPI001FF14557|nr:ABC transporter substrate-binding protein [Ectobacillus sp. JY-23]UOY92237.1 ABC transporter substrate-binding protein [Ectobacillus sp. JY-23]
MKKVTKVLSVAFLTASLALVGCSSKESTSTEKQSDKIGGTITFITNRTDLVDTEYKKIEEAFKKKYPDVKDVKFEALRNYDGDIKVRLSSKQYGDALLIPNGVSPEQFANYFEPLNDLGLEDKVYFPDIKAYKDKMYGVTSGVVAEGIVYNKKAFEKAGIQQVPKTLDELYAAAEKLKQAGIVPLATNFNAQWPLQQWDKLPQIMTGNADFRNTLIKENEPFAKGTPYEQSLSILKTFIDKGYTEPDLIATDWESSKGDMAQGKFGMMFLGNWVINQIIENGAKPADIGFFPFPTDNSGKVKSLMGSDWCYAVSKNSKNVATAKAFVKFLVEESGYDDFSGLIPTIKDKEPKIPQLQEFLSYKPELIYSVSDQPELTNIANKAQIDFYGGKYVQDLMLNKNYENGLKDLNEKWKKAKDSLNIK